MGTRGSASGRYLKFVLYLAAVVLINVAGTTLFFHIDMTGSGMYSLSEASSEAVSTLSDPLTVKVFFSENLPAPYNNVERYLHDLLEEYAVAGNRYFNYEFYDISDEGAEASKQNRDIAGNYGIYPVQLQNIEQDEVKFQKAFMGMALIQGDAVEKIPTVTTTDGLEYQITGKIRKLNNKVSALLNLKEPVEVLLFLSSSLQLVGPYMNLARLEELPGMVEGIVKELNTENYGKIVFRYLDPTKDPALEKEAEGYHTVGLRWEGFTDRRGENIPAGKGYVGLVVRHGDESEEIGVLQVIRIPILGTQYELMDPEQLKEAIGEAVDGVIHISEGIGYLVSHGCRELGGGYSMPGQEQEGAVSNLYKLMSEDYSVDEVDLKGAGIPEGLNTLIVAGPKERFSEYELYQLDQFLMKGKNILFFLDAFNEIAPPQQQAMFRQNQGPMYVPNDTGLNGLLEHYGVVEEAAYVLDEKCYKQRVPEPFGGGDRPIYFAPIIQKDEINRDLKVLDNIKGLVMLKAAPLRVDEAKVKENGLKPSRLFSSSKESWEMEGRIDLNPMFMRPPADKGDMKSFPLAYMVEGGFQSYFAGKPIPEKPKEEGDSESGGKVEGAKDTSRVESTGVTMEKGKPSKLLLVGTSEILQNNIVDEDGRGPNAQFVMNMIDLFSGREANAIMRAKTQRFNPMGEIKPGMRTAIKTFNIAGLPVLVVLAGLLVWLRRISRKRRIQNMFRA